MQPNAYFAVVGCINKTNIVTNWLNISCLTSVLSQNCLTVFECLLYNMKMDEMVVNSLNTNMMLFSNTIINAFS